ncbi:MAG: heavy-metal-associated domain-containing protein [Dermatophilaceae bacterium]
MSGASCERRIAKALTALPGVISASASTRKGTVSLIATDQASRASIEAAVVKLGYRPGGSPWLNRDPQVCRRAAVAAGPTGSATDPPSRPARPPGTPRTSPPPW